MYKFDITNKYMAFYINSLYVIYNYINPIVGHGVGGRHIFYIMVCAILSSFCGSIRFNTNFVVVLFRFCFTMVISFSLPLPDAQSRCVDVVSRTQNTRTKI